MCLDICPPADASRQPSTRGGAPPALGGAGRARADGQLRFGIAQGGVDPELRGRSIAGIVELLFDGYALGGLAVGESRGEMLDAVAWAPAPLAERPRYFMGLGDAEGIPRSSRGGSTCSTASCRRTARTGSALTSRGRLNLRNARFARDPRPLEDGCGCPACAGSRGRSSGIS